MRVTRLSGSEGGGILCDSPYPYSDCLYGSERIADCDLRPSDSRGP